MLAFAAAYLTSEGAGKTGIIHMWSGYTVGMIVTLRLVWGFIGPRHARFVDFVYRPTKVLRYLYALSIGRAHRYIGHSPAGGAMVLALLICLAGTVITGLYANADVVLAHTLVHLTQASAERAQGGGESLVGEVHAMLANLTLALVVLHVLGVGLASIIHRENLVRAIIDGHKRPAK